MCIHMDACMYMYLTLEVLLPEKRGSRCQSLAVLIAQGMAVYVPRLTVSRQQPGPATLAPRVGLWGL